MSNDVILRGRPATIKRVFGEGGTIVTIVGVYTDEDGGTCVVHWDHSPWRHFVEDNRDLRLPFDCRVIETDDGTHIALD